MDLRSDPVPASSSDSPLPPRVSVIIPVRNDPVRLGKCLAAIQQSTFRDFEVIVTDDASTDSTAAVAESACVQLVRLPRQSGAAAARNAAAAVARGSILMFVDADVCVHPNTLEVAVKSFDDPALSAVFGSYDLNPPEPNLLSQYKNLAHRFFHQESTERVSTFWTGCGAMRREAFDKFKFDPVLYPRPSIEDIDLGTKIARSGGQIRISKDLQATHLKRWTLLGVLKSDLFDRAIPWTKLIYRNRDLPIDLNLGLSQRLAAILTALSSAIFLAACWFRPWLAAVPVAVVLGLAFADAWTHRHRVGTLGRAIAGILILGGLVAAIAYAGWWGLAILAPLAVVLLINQRFYRFFLVHRGPLFAAAAVPMKFAYYLYSLVGFAVGTVLHWVDHPEVFDAPRTRVKIYWRIAAVLYVASWSLVLVRAKVRDTTIDFAVSDATGFYVYLPSVVIDHDVNFENQIRDQQMKDPAYVRALRHNRWQSGIALSLSPAFMVAHGVARVGYALTGSNLFKPHGYSPVYFVFCVGWALVIGTVGMIVMDRLVTERLKLPGWMALSAVLTTWLGTNYLWYFTREPLLAHMLGAAWISFSVYLVHLIERSAIARRLVWWQLPALAFTLSMGISIRVSNAFIAPVCLYLLVVLIRERMILPALRLSPLIVLGLAPIAVHFAAENIIQGHVAPVVPIVQAPDMQGRGYDSHEKFYFTRPALLRTLFSSRHGLFFSCPALLLAAWGVIRHLLRPRKAIDPLIASFAISSLLLWYVNAAWYAWWFGPSVGHRGFVELAGLYVIGFALGFEWLSTVRPSGKRTVLVLLAFGFAVNGMLMAAKLVDLVQDNQTLIPWEDRVLKGGWERL